MAWYFEQEELENLYKEFNSESDIAVTVLAGSYIDRMMRELLLCHLKTGSTSKSLLDPNKGKLSDYKTKADLLYCLNLLNKDIYQDICAIAVIRNKFAHDHCKMLFIEDNIKILIGNLKSPKDENGNRASKMKNNEERTDFLLAVSSIIVKINDALMQWK